jgi:hypothetical protein
MGNIFIQMEMPFQKNFDYEISFIEGDYQRKEDVMKRNAAKKQIPIKARSVEKGPK